MLPVRCYSCGEVIGHAYGDYLTKQRNGRTAAEALDELDLRKLCCRRMLLTHVDVLEKIMLMEAIKKPDIAVRFIQRPTLPLPSTWAPLTNLSNCR